MHFNGISRFLGALAIAFAAAQPAHADLITKRMFGTVTTAGTDNVFDLEIGDTLGGFATFDSALLTGRGIETLSADDHASLQFSLRIGSFTFDRDDQRSLTEGPHFIFENGQLVGIQFIAEFRLPELDTPDMIKIFDFELLANSNMPQFRFSGPDVQSVSGVFGIPEPWSLAVFGAGLVGSGLLQRRRKGGLET
jgi:hypothetical protein